MTEVEGHVTDLDILQDTITTIMKAMVAWAIPSNHTTATAMMLLGIDEMKRMKAGEEEIRGLFQVLLDMPLLEIRDDSN